MTLEGDFEGASSGHLGEGGTVLVRVGNEVAVEVEGKVCLGNLVAHRYGVWDAFNDGLGDCRYVSGVGGDLPLLK